MNHPIDMILLHPPRILLAATCLLFLFSCSTAPTTSSPTILKAPAPTLAAPTSTPYPTSTPVPPSDHRIGVRVVDGVGEFFDRVTGEKFIPRGMNYIHLGLQTDASGNSTTYHAVFDPGKYDSQQIASDLVRMQSDGYNVVRVFLSQNTLGSSGGGLSAAYMGNIVNFLKLAKQTGIFVMFTQDWLPGGKYGELINPDCCTQFTMMNLNYLSPAGLKANQAFFKDFVSTLIGLNAPMDAIFSFELRNEMFFETDLPPLSLKEGTVTAANGQTYELSNAADKQRMVEDNLVYWIDQVRLSILQVDPTALVSVGFFHPQVPNRSRIGDTRLAVAAPAIWNSQADFIDLHAYPAFELNLKQYVQNFGVNGMKTKPIVMGEFGGEVSRIPSVAAAARLFVKWQVESCGYGFDGWIFWTWNETEEPGFYNALQGDGQIEKALAPVTRPDPCKP
jgi:hypothetical protein